jgi:hypothetical protein
MEFSTAMKIELAILGIMVGLTGVVFRFTLNTRRALKEAVKEEVPTVVNELLVHFNARFADYERKISMSAKQAYVSGMQAIQAFYTCANAGMASVDRETLKVVWEKLMVTGSLLQVQYGDSEEVITGANNLYHLAPASAARAALAARLKRKDTDPEATATLQSRLRELEMQTA